MGISRIFGANYPVVKDNQDICKNGQSVRGNFPH